MPEQELPLDVKGENSLESQAMSMNIALENGKVKENLIFENKPKVFIHENFPYISLSPESVAQLLKSYKPDISDKELGQWSVEVTPFAALSKEEEKDAKKQDPHTVYIDRRRKNVRLHPDVPGERYFTTAPTLRRMSKDPEYKPKLLERWNMKRQLRSLENIPELKNLPEEHAKNIEDILNTYLYSATDRLFNKTKNDMKSLSGRVVTNLANWGGRALLFKILFDINPTLAIGVGVLSAFGISLPVTIKIIKGTEKRQKDKSQKREEERRERFQNIINVNEEYFIRTYDELSQ